MTSSIFLMSGKSDVREGIAPAPLSIVLLIITTNNLSSGD
ncbi:FIG00639935: hypothetical protein [Escherichia coli ISC41]|nr:FIG00639935: hypothetical protein [Escherichia coli ISC41]